MNFPQSGGCEGGAIRYEIGEARGGLHLSLPAIANA
jgi:hypothetical protein